MAAAGRGAVADVATPALLIDLAQLDRNISSMAQWAAGTVSLRPHAKAHKCVEIARRQRAAGALGVTTATVWEALAMARADVGEVLLSSQTVVPEKLAVLAAAARTGRVLVALDSPIAAERLSEALRAAGSTVGVLVEIDVGMGRGGARSIDEAAELARHIDGTDRLELRGVMGYEGHAVLERDPTVAASWPRPPPRRSPARRPCCATSGSPSTSSRPAAPTRMTPPARIPRSPRSRRARTR